MSRTREISWDTIIEIRLIRDTERPSYSEIGRRLGLNKDIVRIYDKFDSATEWFDYYSKQRGFEDGKAYREKLKREKD